ncbi:hypothetical protein B0T26DRAFT_678394 [Lasiosphaeria miniovina]|uniref:Uncharacterized protein n=1 Tax=Lasiosphaeria miniovina TaxID=1954250 RepID=A0AA40DWC3_9PEZI|nr:uncharacterized protein B0T26DRAFT_678394 [Lasiosphaeria miniovina]KAK0714153.1 hypothetical protein B0T26DRAFT_678394 [Lasiosphaeria miniovina]
MSSGEWFWNYRIRKCVGAGDVGDGGEVQLRYNCVASAWSRAASECGNFGSKMWYFPGRGATADFENRAFRPYVAYAEYGHEPTPSPHPSDGTLSDTGDEESAGDEDDERGRPRMGFTKNTLKDYGLIIGGGQPILQGDPSNTDILQEFARVQDQNDYNNFKNEAEILKYTGVKQDENIMASITNHSTVRVVCL